MDNHDNALRGTRGVAGIAKTFAMHLNGGSLP